MFTLVEDCLKVLYAHLLPVKRYCLRRTHQTLYRSIKNVHMPNKALVKYLAS